MVGDISQTAVDFATSQRIIFGKGAVKNLVDFLDGLGKRAFVVRSKSASIVEVALNILDMNDIQSSTFTVPHEPDVEIINNAVKLAREFESDFVIAVGGGSIIDTAKAVSAMLNNEGALLDYLEVVGKGQKIDHPAKPCLVIPTTSGTGSEVTRNAVISVPEKNVKVSMRSPKMIPSIALVDPEATYDVPPEITAVTGMDAFTQVIEPYVSVRSNAMVDMFCKDAVPRAAEYLFRAYENGTDEEARNNMAWVSLMGGLSLANAGLGAVHGFAGPIGGMFHAAHGAVCAALLPAVMKVNVEAINKDPANENTLVRYREIAAWITGNSDADPVDGVLWLESLSEKLNIPKLNEMGIQANDFPAIIEKARASSSMKGNPVKLDEEQLSEILERSF